MICTDVTKVYVIVHVNGISLCRKNNAKQSTKYVQIVPVFTNVPGIESDQPGFRRLISYSGGEKADLPNAFCVCVADRFGRFTCTIIKHRDSA